MPGARSRQRIRRREGGEIRDVVGQRVASAQSGPAGTEDVPRKSQARTEILIVDVVKTVNSLSGLHQAHAGKEICGNIISVAQVAEDVVTQSEGQSEPGFDLPIILRVETNRVLDQMPVSVAERPIGVVGLAQQQFFDGVLNRVRRTWTRSR